MTISGLDPSKKYDVYTSHARGATGPVNIIVTIDGTASGDLDEATGSGPVTFSKKDIVPTSGSIIIRSARGTNNTSFAHLNGIILVEHT